MVPHKTSDRCYEFLAKSPDQYKSLIEGKKLSFGGLISTPSYDKKVTPF